jgi:mismatch-specific thymine-DNA glycosylase
MSACAPSPGEGALPEYLRPGLDLVFVGINPGRRSAETGHHYAGRGNAFWPLLYESGLVPEPLSYEDDWRAPEFGIGLTNLVQRWSPSMSDLSLEEMRKGAERLRQNLRRYRPRVVCFNGKGIYEVFKGRRCAYGLQPERAEGALVYVMPSTSGRTAGLTRADKLAHFRELALVTRLRREEAGR